MKFFIKFLIFLFILSLGYFLYLTGVWDNLIKPKVYNFFEINERTGSTFLDSVANAKKQIYPVNKIKKEIDSSTQEQKMQESIFKKEREKLEALRTEIESLMTTEKKTSPENFKKLAKIYENMQPKEVAILSENLSDTLLANILLNMNIKKAGKIMGEISKKNPKKGAILSNLIVNLKTKK